MLKLRAILKSGRNHENHSNFYFMRIYLRRLSGPSICTCSKTLLHILLSAAMATVKPHRPKTHAMEMHRDILDVTCAVYLGLLFVLVGKHFCTFCYLQPWQQSNHIDPKHMQWKCIVTYLTFPSLKLLWDKIHIRIEMKGVIVLLKAYGAR